MFSCSLAEAKGLRKGCTYDFTVIILLGGSIKRKFSYTKHVSLSRGQIVEERKRYARTEIGENDPDPRFVSILFGHPTGSPFSHHAALAHWEAGHLDRFCVPWMPSTATLRALEYIKPLQSMTKRLGRRHFAPLAQVPKVQGRANELLRLLIRASGRSSDWSSDDANDWLMKTMASECQHSAVTAVHAYEDCSLWQFVEAKRLGKACIYDLPIGYYFAWEQIQRELVRKYADWLPATTMQPEAGRLEQKRREVELADLLLVPSSFVANTVRDYHPNQQVVIAPYGVNLVRWQPALARQPSRCHHVSFRRPMLCPQGRSASSGGVVRGPSEACPLTVSGTLAASRKTRKSNFLCNVSGLGRCRARSCSGFFRRPMCSYFPPISRAVLW